MFREGREGYIVVFIFVRGEVRDSRRESLNF